MIVRIRFGRGRALTHRKGKNGKAALLLASLLTLVALSLGILGFWRLGEDLGFTGDFVFATGLLSHWQVWLGAAGVLQYGSWRLTRYSRISRAEAAGREDPESEVADEPAIKKATARI